MEATATLPSTTSAVAMGNATENMALPSGGEGERGSEETRTREERGPVEAPQTVMITAAEYVNSIDGEALVGDFVRAAEDMRDKMELDDRAEGEDCSDAIMMSELRDFSSRCEILRKRGLLKECRQEIIKTLSMLERVSKGANETVIEMNDHSRGVNAQRVMKAMEAMAVYFVILSSADMREGDL